MAEQVAVVFQHGAAAGSVDDQCLQPELVNLFYPVDDILPEAFLRQGCFAQVVFDCAATGRFRQQVDAPAQPFKQTDTGRIDIASDYLLDTTGYQADDFAGLVPV